MSEKKFRQLRIDPEFNEEYRDQLEEIEDSTEYDR